jgi:HTH-type transcriptional regulator/antitoxin HipB
MKNSIQHIGPLLKKARLEKGMSQRELGLLIGLPQGHLSKIESGLIDLQLSSFIELARALDLEVTLVHRSLVHTVAILQNETVQEKKSTPRPMYSLEDVDEE